MTTVMMLSTAMPLAMTDATPILFARHPSVDDSCKHIFDVTMALCGVSKIGDITRDVLAATESQRSI